MKVTIIGRLADSLGLASKEHVDAEVVVGGHLRAWRSVQHYAVGAMEYRSRQPKYIGVDIEHDKVVGRVVHLERSAGQLWLVGVLDEPERVPTECRFLSAAVTMDPNGTDVELTGVALTADPASIGAMPIVELAGDLRTATRGAWRLKSPFLTTLLEHARDSTTGTAHIAGECRPTPTRQAWPLAARSAGSVVLDGTPVPIEIRDIGRVTHVDGVPVRSAGT